MSSTKYAAYGYLITDPDDVARKIVEIKCDEYIIVESDIEPNAGTWTLYSPVYLHGTPKAINAEATNTIQAGGQIYPLIWFLEIAQFDRSYDPLSMIQDTPDIRMFFMDEANYRDWDTYEHYEQVIKPMINLADMMCKSIRDDGRFDKLETTRFTNHAKFGLRYTNPKTADNYSHVKNLLNENVSGVELRLKVPIRKSCK